MQRKRRNINFGNFSKSPGKHQKQFTNSITKLTLHSIPTVRMSKISNKKSLVAKRNPFCGRSEKHFISLASTILLILGLIFSNLTLINNHASAFEPDISPSATDQNSDSDYSLLPLAASAGISISGDAVDKQVAVAPGDIGYREHTININASDISNYTLIISGPANLVGPSGATAITGANNKKPNGTGNEAMLDNTWGYGWGDLATSKENLSYQSLSPSGTNLASGNTATTGANAGKLTLSKKLAFAVKFAANNTDSGHYRTTVKLSLTATPATTTYTLSYNANSGSNAPSNQTCTANGAYGTSCTLTLSSTKPSRNDYTFLGWSTSSTATSASYQPGASITLTGNQTLYAVWKQVEKFTVTFHAGSAQEQGLSTPPNPVSCTPSNGSCTITLSAPSPTRVTWPSNNCSAGFLGWTTDPNGSWSNLKHEGETFTVTGNVILYAAWKTSAC